MMLCTRDSITGDYLVIDGDEVVRVRTRAEALEIANSRYERALAEAVPVRRIPRARRARSVTHGSPTRTM